MSTEVGSQTDRRQSPRNWIVTLQVFGLSLATGYVAGAIWYVAWLIAKEPLHLTRGHLPPIWLRIATWTADVVLTAFVAYAYGRWSRRKLPIGYVLCGWLLWPLLSLPIVFVAHIGYTAGGALWTFGTAILYTLATKWGERNRPSHSREG